jgi:hypothetical protein
MQRNLPSEEIRFANNVSVMGQAISTGINKLHKEGYKVIDPITVVFALSVIESHGKENPHDLIDKFISRSHEECWDKIKERDEKYFIENMSNIFNMIPQDSVNIFKDLFTTVDKNGCSVIPIQLKEEIWNLFDALIKISIKYIYKQNKHNNKYSHIDLDRHCHVWSIKL